MLTSGLLKLLTLFLERKKQQKYTKVTGGRKDACLFLSHYTLACPSTGTGVSELLALLLSPLSPLGPFFVLTGRSC
jgi:hypothetical protein